MSRLSGSIHTLRAGLVEAINAAGLPPCIVLEQVRGQVAVLERQEEAEKEEEQEAEDGALQSAE